MPHVYRLDHPPSASEYAAGLSALESKLHPTQLALLRAQYNAPERTATARELAVAAGLPWHSVVNSHYGRLGRMLCMVLGFDPMERGVGGHRWWATLSVGYSAPERGFLWQMYPELAEALEVIGWVDSEVPIPELDMEFGSAREGRLAWTMHLRRERDPMLARQKKATVRRRDGSLACEVCGLRFDDLPLELGEACCEIHHGRPLGDATGEVETKLTDLHVLCANCHRMIHRSKPFRSVAEMCAAFVTAGPNTGFLRASRGQGSVAFPSDGASQPVAEPEGR